MANYFYDPAATFALAIFLGVLLSVLARKVRVPAIVPLLIGGVMLGPEGIGLIQPTSLGDGLPKIVSLCVAIILFEGGMTLEPGGFKQARIVLVRLLTVGVLITWLGTATAIYFLFNLPIGLSLLAGSLIIVTGPTVVAPLLHRIRVRENLHHILHWEGVLVDPIGVFIAILVFEWLSIDATAGQHLGQFALRLFVGSGVGALGGQLLYRVLKKDYIPQEQINIVVFSSALLIFVVSELFVHEAGILAVVISGMILGWRQPEGLKHILRFKSELTEMAIGILFILLAANLQLDRFLSLGINGVFVVLIVLLFIRPLSILVCTFRSDLDFRERAFLGWTAPRGVVAGSMAALFSLQLGEGSADAYFLEAFTFSIIGSTVIFQGLLTGSVAKLLGVEAPPRRGWLIVGAHAFGQHVAGTIMKETGAPVLLVDTNADAVQEARTAGYTAVRGNATSLEVASAERMNTIGNLLALTDNRDLNQLICSKWTEEIPRGQIYYWSPPEVASEEKKNDGVAIWTEMPKPSVVAYDISLGRSKLVFADPGQLRAMDILLAQEKENGLVLSDEMKPHGGQCLLYRRKDAAFPLFVREEQVIDLVADGFDDVIAAGVSAAVEAYPILDEEVLLAAFRAKKIGFPTVLGNGVALPHVHSADITEPVCVVVRLQNKLVLPEVDDQEPLRLVFVVISPSTQPQIHLNLLADIAKLTAQPQLIEQVLTATKRDEVVRLLGRVKGV